MYLIRSQEKPITIRPENSAFPATHPNPVGNTRVCLSVWTLASHRPEIGDEILLLHLDFVTFRREGCRGDWLRFISQLISPSPLLQRETELQKTLFRHLLLDPSARNQSWLGTRLPGMKHDVNFWIVFFYENIIKDAFPHCINSISVRFS